MELIFIIALLFVIVFSVLLQFIFKNSYLVAAVITIFNLIIYAMATDLFAPVFIVWIVIYGLIAFLVSFLTGRLFGKKNRCGGCSSGCDRDDF